MARFPLEHSKIESKILDTTTKHSLLVQSFEISRIYKCSLDKMINNHEYKIQVEIFRKLILRLLIGLTYLASYLLLRYTSNKSTGMVQSQKIISSIILSFASNY